MKKNCLQCGNEFSVANWNAERKFCKKECVDKYIDLNNRVTKICKICNKEFRCNKAKAEWKVCCSKECSEELKKKIESKVTKICVVCNKEFESLKCHPYKICCSPECNKKWSLRFKVKENCVICGKEKWVAPSRHRANNPICGAKECKRKQLQEIREGDKNPNYKGVVREIPCIICGTVTKDYCNNKRFCSKKCKDKWQETGYKGVNGTFYGKHHTEEMKRLSSERNKKGEWQNINRAFRFTSKMKQWKKDVFKRDNWTCQKCGDRNGNGKAIYLHAHHIVSLAELIASYTDIEEKFKKDDYTVLHDDFFYDIYNGICYCDSCHREEHKRDDLDDLWINYP